MSDGAFIGKMLLMTGGLLVWALHFTVIYAFSTVACAQGFAGVRVLGAGIVPFVIGATTVMAWVAIMVILASAGVRSARLQHGSQQETTENFQRYATAVVAMLSLLAVAWNALPALMIRPC